MVEEIVKHAPDIGDWQVFALKPKIEFPVTTRWESVKVKIADVLAQPVFKDTGEMGLRMFVPGLDESNRSYYHNALLRALDAGLGERRFAESVSATWVYPLSEAEKSAFPLPELEAYLNERNNGS